MDSTFTVVNTRTGAVLATAARRADSFWSRAVGLMGAPHAGGGLFIEPCSSIHTFFMRCSIDVLFLSSTNEVLATYCPMPPWRMTRWVAGARKVLELDAGGALDTHTGDILQAVPCA